MEIKLREIRESRNLTIQQMVNRLGVKDSRYRKWESNTAQIPLKYACSCANILHCTLDELAGRKVIEKPSISAKEQHMIEVYRAASEHGRVLIDAVIEGESHHIDENAKNEEKIA